jgi:hypothetical protein
MPSPNTLPLEARRAAMSRLWDILLREPAGDEELREAQPYTRAAETSSSTASEGRCR